MADVNANINAKCEALFILRKIYWGIKDLDLNHHRSSSPSALDALIIVLNTNSVIVDVSVGNCR